MKRSIKNLLATLALALLCLPLLNAQDVRFQARPGHYTLGINGGWAYQQGDVRPTLDGFGFGLTLAKNLYLRPQAPLSFDIRGRFLYSQSYGLDHTASSGIENDEAINGSRANGLDYTTDNGGPGFVYRNHRTDIAELGLEGVLTLNKLRERTGIVASLYGGINLDWYLTRTNQTNADGTSYAEAYETLNQEGSKTARRNALRNDILDNSFETRASGFGANGKLGFMPAVGLELGYHFTPRFYMGIGHKATFARTDLLDGNQWNNDNSVTSNNDLHHYTSIHARWILERKRKMIPPIIDITSPATCPHTTRSPNIVVRADIQHVNSSMDVDCRVNGRPVDFSFYNGDFVSDISLEPGRNDVVITATNPAGEDEESCVIIYNSPNTDRPIDLNSPVVTITNPSDSPFTVDASKFNVKANIRNVNNQRDIQFKVNGRDRDFTYNARTETLSANLNLVEGKNEIRITANNSSGTASDDAVIYFEAYKERPTVEITVPNNNYETNNNRVDLTAVITNVDRKDDIRLIVNGRNQTSFNYSRGRLSSPINLREGNNTVRVEANNDGGSDSDEINVVYRPNSTPTQTGNRPDVTITGLSFPVNNGNSCSTTLTAKVLNVKTKDDIRLKVNNQNISNFNYNVRTKVVTSTFNISAGQNNVVLSATNAVGSDEDRRSIECSAGGIGGTNLDAPVVTITSPSSTNSTTTTASFRINATVLNVTRKSDIDFYLNNNRITNFTFSSSSKTFTANITLKEGNNNIRIIAENGAGTDEDAATIKYIKEDITPSRPPRVSISKPTNNSETDTQNASVRATVKYVAGKNNIELKLNGSRITNFSYSASSDVLTATVSLREGTNTISIKATNDDGNDQEQVTVRYKKQVVNKKPPTVDITAPSNNSTSSIPTTNLKATIKNISSKSGIKITLNGKNVPSFNYSNGNLSANITLRDGSNTVVVKATNNDGNDSDQVKVTYKKPVVIKKPPSVKITAPSNNANVTSASSKLKATIKNVSSKSGITVTLNGKSVPNFSYSNGNLSANITLKDGSNTIKVKATNNDGSDDETVRVTYKKPVAKPTVRFVNPKRPGTTVTSQSFNLKGTVTNVTRKQDITVKVNGRTISGFSFDAKRNEVTAKVSLSSKGKNTLEIIAKNTSGSANAKSDVTYKAKPTVSKNPPKVTIVSTSQPTVNPFNQDVGRSTIIATITNITSKGQITVTVNGTAISNSKINWNASTNTMNVTVDVVRGNNTVIVKGTNPDGSDQKSKTIAF